MKSDCKNKFVKMRFTHIISIFEFYNIYIEILKIAIHIEGGVNISILNRIKSILQAKANTVLNEIENPEEALEIEKL